MDAQTCQMVATLMPLRKCVTMVTHNKNDNHSNYGNHSKSSNHGNNNKVTIVMKRTTVTNVGALRMYTDSNRVKYGRVRRDSEPRTTVLVRTSKNLLNPTKTQ
jgi:hypothetical protein